MTSPSLPRVSDYVAWHARRDGSREALVCNGERVDYAGFDRRVDALAKALMAAGVQAGDRVATLQAPSADYLIAFMAAASVGAIWLGLNPRARADELGYVITDSQPVLLLTRTRIGDRSYTGDLSGLATNTCLRRIVSYDGGAEFESLASFLASGEAVDDLILAARREATGGRQPCLLVYTSGSTGRPKGALLHHEGIVAFCREQNAQWPINPFRSLNYLPINHVGCTVDLAVPCVIAGGTMIFMEQFDVAASLLAIEAERLTLWASVPSVFAMQAASPVFNAVDYSSVQLVLWEGAAMPADVFARIADKAAQFATSYGMTETCGITALPPTDDREMLLGSVGLPFPGVDVRLADSSDRVVPHGEAGEVQVRSPFTFLGYWQNPAATAASFTADGFFRTGDLARCRPEGGLTIVGRLKEMYKSGGYNVYPREVEEVLEAHPDVAAAAVVGTADTLWGEVGVAFVVAKPGSLAIGAEILAWCRDRLSNYKLPKRIVVLDELPLLPIGKVDRKLLAASARDGD